MQGLFEGRGCTAYEDRFTTAEERNEGIAARTRPSGFGQPVFDAVIIDHQDDLWDYRQQHKKDPIWADELLGAGEADMDLQTGDSDDDDPPSVGDENVCLRTLCTNVDHANQINQQAYFNGSTDSAGGSAVWDTRALGCKERPNSMEGIIEFTPNVKSEPIGMMRRTFADKSSLVKIEPIIEQPAPAQRENVCTSHPNYSHPSVCPAFLVPSTTVGDVQLRNERHSRAAHLQTPSQNIGVCSADPANKSLGASTAPTTMATADPARKVSFTVSWTPEVEPTSTNKLLPRRHAVPRAKAPGQDVQFSCVIP